MATFERYIQVLNQPRPIYTMFLKRGTAQYIPDSAAYKPNIGLTSLMDAVYARPGSDDVCRVLR